jgi:MYXO-CTERM domain-containing protein
MTNRNLHLAMFAVAGLALPATLEGTASAEVGAAKVTKLLGPSTRDTAPVTNTNPPRLRRTDEEQAGAEQSTFTFFGDYKSGVYFEMRSGEINGQLPNDRIQLAMVPFHLEQATDGSVGVVADMTGAKFITNNNGNEYRNANTPSAFTINGNVACVEYNYQPNNDTQRYLQCYNQAGTKILGQTKVYAKNNDDCSMAQDTAPMSIARTTTTGTKAVVKLIAWRGCNGNGNDNGWAQAYSIELNDAANPTAATFKNQFDVTLANREERSRGFCSVGTDPDTAICSWTEGNNQPQRDGTWLAAINISDNITGNDKQGSILWKQQIDGRKGQGDTRTYSVRAKHERILTVDPTTKALVPSDDIIWHSDDLHGNNSNNNGKGGTNMQQQIAVFHVTKTGMTPVAPLQPVAFKQLVGLDGTHVGMGQAMFGTTDAMKPGVMFIGGSQTGGGYSAKVRALQFDPTTKEFSDLGSYSIAPYDRHLYPNYLGNNPGNQGRNFSNAKMIPNPFVGKSLTPADTVSKDAYLTVFSTTGKDPADMMQPELKLSSYLTVLPVVTVPDAAPTPGGGSGSDDPAPQPNPTPEPNPTPDPQDPADPGTSLGGCSAGGGAAGGLTFLLIGMAAFIRRRK